MDDLAVADTGIMGHYLTLELPCKNKQQAVHPLLIQMPNGKIITSTHTSLLSQPDLPLQAQNAHIFPGLNKALLSIVILCNYGCEATFNDRSVCILNKQGGKIIKRGTQDTHTNLYILNLTQKKKLMTESTTLDENFAGSVYECKSKITLVDYHHAF